MPASPARRGSGHTPAPADAGGVRESLRRLGGDSLIYGFGQVSGKAVNLLLVPILTRVLVPQQYGVADLVVSYSASLLLVLVFGMDGALARFFYEQPDGSARVRMVSSSFVFRLVTGGVAASLLVALSEPLASRYLGDPVYAKYLRIGALSLPLTLFTLFSNDVLRVTFQPWKFILLNLSQTVLVGGLTLVLVLVRDLGVAGVLYGKLFGDGLTALLGLVLCRHYLRPNLDAALLRKMLAYGLPLVPAAVAYSVIGFVDREALQRTASLDAVGVYAVAMKFFAVITMGISAFNMAFGPFAYAKARESGAPKLFARVLALYVATSSLGALLVGMFAPVLVGLLATDQYAAAAGPALWLGFAAVAQGAYSVVALGINLSLKTHLLGAISAVAASVAVVANQWMVPRWGAEGAAIATFLAHVTSTVLAYLVAQRVRAMPYRGARLAVLFAAALGLGLAVTRWGPPGPAGLVTRLAALAVFAALAVAFEIWKDRGAVRHGRPGAAQG